ncbi:MAG: hypothetical protein AAGD25_09615 [Cyanobacteria bacterium P01_F01_bin.150]
MGQSVDDLLNAIKQEYEKTNVPSSSANPSSANASSTSSPSAQKASSNSSSSPGRSPTQSSQRPNHKLSNQGEDAANSTSPLLNKADSIDDLLADLGVTPKEKTPPPTPFSTVRESSDYSSVTEPSSSASIPSSTLPVSFTSASSRPINKTGATDSVLNQVKQQYAAEEAERERQRQEALEADRRLQRQLEEQARQQQLAAERRQRQLEEQRKAELLKKAEIWLKGLDPNSDEGFWFESFAVNYPSKLDAALDYLDAMDRAG